MPGWQVGALRQRHKFSDGDLKDFGALMNKRKKTKGDLIQAVGNFLDPVVQDSWASSFRYE
jgi:hypothetical protein